MDITISEISSKNLDKIKNTFFKINTDFPSGIKKLPLMSPPGSDESLFNISSAKRKRYLNFPPYGLGLLANIARSHSISVDMRVVQICKLDALPTPTNIPLDLTIIAPCKMSFAS
jgi:hypothetical protein